MRQRGGRQSTAYFLLAVGVAAAIVGIWFAVRPAERTGQPALQPAPRVSSRALPPLFAPNSVWNKLLPANAIVDPASSALVARLAREVAAEQQQGIGPYIATSEASTPLYVVGRHQRRVPVALEADGTPGQAGLARALRSVPIPPNARPAAGPDRHMVIWQPSTDSMWELFGAVRMPHGWRAKWGGAMTRVSRSPGYYTPAAWPGAAYTWGATATSLPVVAGTALVSELRAGRIDHALALALPYPRAGQFAWPAQRSDGTGGPGEIPEGARLRLDPRLDLASLHMPPLTRELAVAAQRYGMIVRDQTHHAIGLYFQDPTPLAHDAYGAIFGGMTPNEVLAAFPWSRLEVVRMHLCARAPCLPPRRAGNQP
jgi:hypothetical protein